MSVHIDARCLQCHFDKNLSTARKLGTEEQALEFAFGLMQVYLSSPRNVGSTWYGPATDALFQRIYGLPADRFAQEKAESNAFVLARLDALRARVRAARDPVYAGLQFAILGNYIDFSALQNQVSFEKLDEMLDSALEMELDEAAYRAFCADCERGKDLLYLTDNAGEIGFDRIFAEEVARRYPHLEITFCVRGGATLNDATRDDARDVGIPFPVIDNGNRVAGTQLELLGDEARNALDTADLILAKGQANAETLLGSGYNIYFAFLVKCARFIDLFDRPQLTPLFLHEPKQ